MPDLGKEDLLARVQSAIEFSGWRMFIHDESHPFRMTVGSQGDSRNLIIYIWNLSSGGPASVRPSDEYRIQVTGVASPLVTEPSSTTLLLGWYEELKVFAAFEIQRHMNPGWSASVQVRLPTIEQAVRDGFAFQRRNNGELVVVLAPDQFMDYVLHQSQLHQMGQVSSEAQLLNEAIQVEPSAEQMAVIPNDRRETISAVRRFVRERSFRNRVLNAYGHRCAVCRIQLRLVQAAHIVPVHVPGSSDETANGLALCPTHHLTYDVGLLGIDPSYQVLVNEARLNALREERLHGGARQLRQFTSHTILLPRAKTNQPLPKYLQQGMALRGW